MQLVQLTGHITKKPFGIHPNSIVTVVPVEGPTGSCWSDRRADVKNINSTTWQVKETYKQVADLVEAAYLQ